MNFNLVISAEYRYGFILPTDVDRMQSEESANNERAEARLNIHRQGLNNSKGYTCALRNYERETLISRVIFVFSFSIQLISLRIFKRN